MIPTLKLSDIISKWRNALQSSLAIHSYCLEKYNKAPTIQVGINGKTLLQDSACPVIILYPGAKSEGLELQEYSYKLSVGWTILQPTSTVNDNVIEYTGVTECDDLGQLIYQELVQISPDNPVSEVNYSIEPVAYYPRFHGRMDVTLKITPISGFTITY